MPFRPFPEPDGTRTYYATYTAYDGKLILPQFIETPDFLHFKFITLNGSRCRTKAWRFSAHDQRPLRDVGPAGLRDIYVMFSVICISGKARSFS